MEEAIKVFEAGARRAKGTTTEQGLVTSYFANPFGPVQEQELAGQLIRQFFTSLFEQNVKVGEMHTGLAVEATQDRSSRCCRRALQYDQRGLRRSA